MGRDYLKDYDNRNRRRASHGGSGQPPRNPRSSHHNRWNIPRIAGAVACLIGIIFLAFLIPKLASSSDDTPDNTATRLSSKETENPASSGSAVATDTPEPTPSPTPKHRKKAVALTFDDGPSSATTPGLLDTLKKYDVHATFFVQGMNCEGNGEILQREADEGHEIGNHSWDHPNLSNLSMDEVNSQLNRTAKIVKKLCGYNVHIVRPPYGAISSAMRESLKHPMIYWEVDTEDWKSHNTKAIMKMIKKYIQDGSIILMHDIHADSCEAAKTVIPWLLDHDYDVLTVSELMERFGVDMKNGKVYTCARQ